MKDADGCTECADDTVDADRAQFHAQALGSVFALLAATIMLYVWRLRHYGGTRRAAADGEGHGDENDDADKPKGFIARWYAKRKGAILRSTYMLKIVIGYFQVLSTFGTVFAEDLPEELVKFANDLKLLGADFTGLLSTGCWYRKDHYTTLLLYTVTPLVILALLTATYRALWRRHRGDRDVAKAIAAEWWFAVLLLSFCVYPGVSVVVFKTFVCDNFEDDSSALKADYTIDCDAPDRTGWVAYAAFATLVYPVGILAGYVYLLRANRETLRGGFNIPPHLSFLISSYDVECYWYEPVDLVRKFVQTTVVSFSFDGELGQNVATMVICFVAMGVLSSYRPYRESSDNRLAILAQCSLFFIAFAALLHRVDFVDGNVDAADSKDNTSFKLILAVMVFAGPVLALGGFLHAMFYVRQSIKTATLDEIDDKLTAELHKTDWLKMDKKTGKMAKKKPFKWFQTLWLRRLQSCVTKIELPHDGKIIGVAISGGPFCDWERGILYAVFGEALGDRFELKQVGDAADLKDWLTRGERRNGYDGRSPVLLGSAPEWCGSGPVFDWSSGTRGAEIKPGVDHMNEMKHLIAQRCASSFFAAFSESDLLLKDTAQGDVAGPWNFLEVKDKTQDSGVRAGVLLPSVHGPPLAKPPKDWRGRTSGSQDTSPAKEMLREGRPAGIVDRLLRWMHIPETEQKVNMGQGVAADDVVNPMPTSNKGNSIAGRL
ncbi:MAG: hypothetical protein OSB03_15465, partial [Vicinamibacterales bacterium]|nr:hypothetical protein [Vicinamibacterales bacterium]